MCLSTMRYYRAWGRVGSLEPQVVGCRDRGGERIQQVRAQQGPVMLQVPAWIRSTGGADMQAGAQSMCSKHVVQFRIRASGRARPQASQGLGN